MSSEDMSMRCLFGASYIAYEYCREYGIAMEDGLSTASKLIEEKEVGEVDCINAEEAEIILRSVLAAARRAIEHIDQEKLRAKAIMQDQEKVPFTHHSEIIMLATSLDRRLHPVAKVVIEKVLEMYSKVIEESKKEALLKLSRRMYASLEKAIGVIVANVHKNCETFRPDSDDLERSYHPFLPQQKAAENQSSISGQSSRHPSAKNRSESPLSSIASSASTPIREAFVCNLMKTAKNPVDKDMQNNDSPEDSEENAYSHGNSVSASRKEEDKGVRQHRKSKLTAINKYFSNSQKHAEPEVSRKPTAASNAKYRENAKQLLDKGLIRRMSYSNGRELICSLYLSYSVNCILHLTPRWLEGINLKAGDQALLKLRFGPDYAYTADQTQKGAMLVLCCLDLNNQEIEKQVFVPPSGIKIIQTLIKDRAKGKI